jgi:hypothetical protein
MGLKERKMLEKEERGLFQWISEGMGWMWGYWAWKRTCIGTGPQGVNKVGRQAREREAREEVTT